jgi:acylpyruvate hydrolase
MERMASLSWRLQMRNIAAASLSRSTLLSSSRGFSAGVDPARFVEQGKKLIGVGKNYSAHIAELSKGDKPLWKNDPASHAAPVLFMKPTTCYVREGSPIVIPPNIGEVHHEIELGVVIGSSCRHISQEDAMSCVAGYCLLIDLTARDVQLKAKSLGEPWMVAKGYETFCPVSEFIPAAKVENHADLRLWLSVNGQIRQDGNTGNMIHSVPKLISHLSTIMTLEPGDCIATGTPEGVTGLAAGDKVAGGLHVAKTDAKLTGFEFDVV